jgi:hypothetical protein
MRAQHFHAERAEPSAESRSNGLLVKSDGLRQVIDIDVDEQIHCVLRDCRLGAEIITCATMSGSGTWLRCKWRPASSAAGTKRN